MSEFLEITNRDAYGAIRGFVYQVGHTILRWLNLNANEVLELEKGEDIDIVTSILGKDEIQRELEQIKHRESSLSLNTKDVLEALLNFHIHQVNNPSKKLLFRFITNSKPTVEKPVIIKSGKSGIEAWIELYNKVSVTDDDPDLIDIKNHLLQKSSSYSLNKTEGKPPIDSNWDSFNNFLVNCQPSDFKNFLKSFDLSVGNIQASLLEDRISDEILRLGHCNDYTSAKHIYSVLFLNVFNLLTNKGSKILTLTTLKQILKNPEITKEHITIYKIINNVLNIVNNKIDSLHKNQILFTDSLQKLEEGLAAIVDTNRVIELNYDNSFSTSSPTPLTFGSLRKAKVDVLYQMIIGTKWLSLQGAHGLGKSELATLLAKRFKYSYWLDLKSFSNSAIASSVINGFLSQITDTPLNSNREQFYQNIINKLPNYTVIVINDLPLIEYNSELSSSIISIVSALNNSDCKLLTTSNYKIDKYIIDVSNNSIIGGGLTEFTAEEKLVDEQANNRVVNQN